MGVRQGRKQEKQNETETKDNRTRVKTWRRTKGGRKRQRIRKKNDKENRFKS